MSPIITAWERLPFNPIFTHVAHHHSFAIGPLFLQLLVDHNKKSPKAKPALMGFFSNEIQTSELAAGDHIYSYRKTCGYLYPHHGIYVGGDKVVHFMGDTRFLMAVSKSESSPAFCEMCHFDGSLTGVVASCLECFLKKGTLRRFSYGVGLLERITAIRGGCSMATPDSLQVVLERASFFENKKTFGVYDIFENNCMHFAYYCKTGKIKDGKGRAVGVLEVEGSIVKMVRERSLVLFVLNCLASCFMDQQEIVKADHHNNNNSSSLWALLSLMLLESQSRPLLLPTNEIPES